MLFIYLNIRLTIASSMATASRGPGALHSALSLVDKRIPVRYKVSSTNIPENLSQKQSRQNLETSERPQTVWLYDQCYLSAVR